MPFECIVGQQAAKDRLRSLLISFTTRFLILSGPPGIGKKTMANELARVLLCPASGEHPLPAYGEQPNDKEIAAISCASCRYFAAGTHPDSISLFPEKEGKIIPVDEVRKAVVNDVIQFPQLGERKVYVLDGDALNEQAQNALLKTFEEPPVYLFHPAFL